MSLKKLSLKKVKALELRAAAGAAAMADLVREAEQQAQALLASTDRVLVVYGEGAASLYYEGVAVQRPLPRAGA